MPRRLPEGSIGTRPLLARFAEEIGDELAQQISAHFGGRRLYVPHKPPADSDLVKIIGQLPAHRLAKRFGGMSYPVPIASGKRTRILELLAAGETKAEVAQNVGCTERYVYQVQAENQGTPFKSKSKRSGGRKKKKTVVAKPLRGSAAQEDAGQRTLFDDA